MTKKRYLPDLGGYRPGRSLIRKGEIRLEPSSHSGVYIGRIIGPETGFFNATTTLDMHHIPPGANTGLHRHDDTVMLVLTGRGHSLIDGVKYGWEPGDSIHIKPGVWHQHWNTSEEPANILAAKATPLLNWLRPHPMIGKGEDFTDIAESDYVPPHPFGLGKKELMVAPGEEWVGPCDKGMVQRWQDWDKKIREATTIMKGKDVRWERTSLQGGEFNAMLLDPCLGFETRLITLGLQALPPGGRNEAHIHMEAIVYIFRGNGYALVDGKRCDLEEGDCVFVHSGQWHQFISTSTDEARPFTQLRILTMDLTDLYLFPFPWMEEEDESPGSNVAPSYMPKLPWEL